MQQFHREYEVEFAQGPLGLSLQPQFIPNDDSPVSAFPLVVVLRCLPQQQAEQSGKISPGDLLTQINHRPVGSFQDYSLLIAHLRETQLESTYTVLSFSSSQRLSPVERKHERALARTTALENALVRRPEVQMDEVREFAKSGIVGERHRALVWKLLLGVLPKDPARWPQVDADNASAYRQYCDEMFHADKYEDLNHRSHEETYQDALEQGFEPVTDVLNEDILKDVSRTHPNYHFFTQDSTLRMMHRILYIYGRLNMGVGYVQGMNEILAPIVYVFAAQRESNADTCECDAFFCFASLMSDVRDLFIRHLDGETSGLHGTLHRFDLLLCRIDPQVGEHLQQVGVLTQFFAVRPLTTLLTREFELPEVFRLWDAVLGRRRQRFHFVMCCLAAVITTKRNVLLEGDFATCLKALQAPCVVPAHAIVREAERIFALDAALPPGAGAGAGAGGGGARRDSQPRVDEMALDMFRHMSRVARTVVEDAKVAIQELKAASNNNNGD